MLKKFVRLFGGDPNKREIDRSAGFVDQVNSLEADYEALSAADLQAKTVEFRRRLAAGETLDDLLPEAFAAVREAGKRTLGMRHYDVQLIGGQVLHQGKIAEMRTGEGKTLVATLPLYANALALNPAWLERAEARWGDDPAKWTFEPLDGLPVGAGAHLITVNDYLARRDARWMAPIYNALGMSVGVLQMAARTENGKKAFLVNLEHESPHEDQHQLDMLPRADAYAADITYGTNSEFGFDYLRDNMTMRLADRVQRGHAFAIVDEVDNVLIDEARTPLIISGPAQDEAANYQRMAQVVKGLKPDDYEVAEKDRTVTLTEIGELHVEELLGEPLRDPERPEDVTLEQARLLGYLEQALRAQYLYRRNKDYLVQAGKVVIVDEFTGRLMPGRRWSDGLHQAVEAKEGVKVESESVTYATITIQNYFRLYAKLAGMTGTAMTESEEFDKIYKLSVIAVPTNLEYQALRPELGLVEQEDKDELGYKYRYYSRRDDAAHRPVYYRRKDFPDVVYRTEEVKLRAIAQEILRSHVLGRPVLVGTTSVELSERVSNRLRAEPLRRLTQVMLLRKAYMLRNKREEDGRAIQELQFLNGPLHQLDVNEMRKLARELEISFNPEDPANLAGLLELFSLGAADQPRLAGVLQAGIPHEVLNARKHTEESQIIAGAGAFGAVTIATNMAGRGVDIKLGGELAEEILAAANRVLARAGVADPYDLNHEQRRQELLKLDPAQYGIYETEIGYFMQHLADMERVHALGGLHVIGSERHEARRIDNQLRGRAARQGDPGSSRFYLSMEDELMRLFGGAQADALMQRLKIDDALPLEVGLVSRLVEQSQTRVEGANFDVRKHLLEYDDVLNGQRAKIYAQRDRIFTKDDLSEDVTEMLRTEVARRVPEALADAEGPWKLLSWLETIQPAFNALDQVYPSFTLRLIANHLLQRAGRDRLEPAETRQTLLRVAEETLLAEEEHLLNNVQNLLNETEGRIETVLAERMDAVETFLEGLTLEDETDTRKPAELQAELTALARLSLRLTPEQQRLLRSDPQLLKGEIGVQLENGLTAQSYARIIAAVEHRLGGESLELNAASLPVDDFPAAADRILAAIQEVFKQRRERYLGEQGRIGRELEAALGRLDEPVDSLALTRLLTLLPRGETVAFDKKTHRRTVQRTTRLNYAFFAAHLLANRDPEEVAGEVLQHLEGAQLAVRRAWGRSELARLANVSLPMFAPLTHQGLSQALGAEQAAALENVPLQDYPAPAQETVISELGRQVLTEIYRQLLLSVITDLWVDYLTQMEALRVSIGLEAYAQRDPLVQYKNRASALFQELLANMRQGVVNRMFTAYLPRQAGAPAPAQAAGGSGAEAAQGEAQPNGDQPGEEAAAGEDEELTEVSPGSARPANQPGGQSGAGKKKRRRHR